MKKKIAVLANGWNSVSLSQSIKGIKKCTDKMDFDIFVFLSFAAWSRTERQNRGEDVIFDLPDYNDFDGVIVFSSMLNSPIAPKKIQKNILKAGVKAVSIGIEMDGADYVGLDNSVGMCKLIVHLVEKHHVLNPVFIAGPKNNADSNERLSTVRKTLEEYGISLPESKVRYANWEYENAIEAAEDLCKEGNLPDAFICANDYTAIAVCIYLKKMGYDIPKDTIVTGFDNVSFSQIFYPSITTVSQDFEKIGYVAACNLIESIQGRTELHKSVITTECIFKESCGCKTGDESEIARRQFCIDAYEKNMENILFSTHITEMSNILFSCPTFRDLKRTINSYFSLNHSYEGDNFHMIIDKNFIDALKDSSVELSSTYSDTMYSVVSMNNGVMDEYSYFPTEYLIPGYVKREEPAVYAFTSVHSDENISGYIVMGNTKLHIDDSSLCQYMMQVNMSLEKYRQNCRLDEMNKALLNVSIKDPLTGLFNRFGMEQVGVPLFENAKLLGKTCIVMFADVNRLKFINDNFGHLQGDLAIRTVASSVLNELPEQWIAIRYGGDEFIALGVCDDESCVKKFVEDLNKNLEKQVRSMVLAYPLTVSCGYIKTDSGSSENLIDYINKADNLMYENKQKMKQRQKNQAD